MVVDEDVIGPYRELTGAKLIICDLCRQPVAQAVLIRREGLPGLSEPVDILHVCEDCRARMEQEEVPFDEEISAGLQAAED